MYLCLCVCVWLLDKVEYSKYDLMIELEKNSEVNRRFYIETERSSITGAEIRSDVIAALL